MCSSYKVDMGATVITFFLRVHFCPLGETKFFFDQKFCTIMSTAPRPKGVGHQKKVHNKLPPICKILRPTGTSYLLVLILHDFSKLKSTPKTENPPQKYQGGSPTLSIEYNSGDTRSDPAHTRAPSGRAHVQFPNSMC